MLARPPNAAAAVDRAAFHRYIAEINGRRIAVLTGVTTLLCAISFVANYAVSGLRGFSLVTGTGLNVTGIALSGIVYATYRWLRMPGLSAILYGCLVLAWGDLMIPTYLHEIEINHSAHAAQNLVIYFITRYLAAVSVVWRPRR